VDWAALSSVVFCWCCAVAGQHACGPLPQQRWLCCNAQAHYPVWNAECAPAIKL